MNRINIFILILCVFTSCSRKSEADLYREGKAAEEQKNFQLAVERYEEIVKQSATSAYAETSQYRVAVIYNNDLHDPIKAVNAYRTFHTMFPSSNHAPSALFLMGFLFNNELHQYDSARRAYEAFLQQYPTHELAVSAKYELETLGKDPGQIIQSQQDTCAYGVIYDERKKAAK
jgi:outer membrane protein assembly factor BamD (BamD/ComL family)